MGVILLEALGALALLVFIVWWTMFSGRKGGERPDDRTFRDAGQLADLIIGGGYETLTGVPREEILMKYDAK